MRKFIAVLLCLAMFVAMIPAASAASTIDVAIEDSPWYAGPSALYWENSENADEGDLIYARTGTKTGLYVTLDEANGEYNLKVYGKYEIFANHTYRMFGGWQNNKMLLIPISLIGVDFADAFINSVAGYSYSVAKKDGEDNHYIYLAPVAGGASKSFTIADAVGNSVVINVEYIDASYDYYWGNCGMYHRPGCGHFYPNYTGKWYTCIHGNYCYNQNGCVYCFLPSSVYGAYLKVVSLDTNSGLYGNVTVSNHGSAIVVNAAAKTEADLALLNSAKDDHIRIRVKPINSYGRAYAPNTVIATNAVDSAALLAGNKTIVDTEGKTQYVLDEDSCFYINVYGIKAAVANGAATAVTSPAFYFGSKYASTTITVPVYVSITGRTQGTLAYVPSEMTVKVGESKRLEYVLASQNSFAPYMSYSLKHINAKNITFENNVVTGVKAGTSYITITSGSNTFTVKVNVVSETASAPTTAPSQTTGPKAAVTALKLNVRAGAGTGNAVVGVLSQGDQVEVLGVSGNWTKINYNGAVAYVSSSYLLALN